MRALLVWVGEAGPWGTFRGEQNRLLKVATTSAVNNGVEVIVLPLRL